MAKSSHKEDSYKEEAEAQIRGGVGGGEWWVEKGACASILSARSVGFDPTTKYDYRDAHPVTIHSPLWLSSLGRATTAVGSAEPRQLLVPMQRSIGNVWPTDLYRYSDVINVWPNVCLQTIVISPPGSLMCADATHSTAASLN